MNHVTEDHPDVPGGHPEMYYLNDKIDIIFKWEGTRKGKSRKTDKVCVNLLNKYDFRLLGPYY